MSRFLAEKMVIGALLLLLIGSGAVVISKATQSFSLPSFSSHWVNDFATNILSSLSTKSSQSNKTLALLPSPTVAAFLATPTAAIPSLLPTRKPTIPPRPLATQPASPMCNRFTVTHLDGSTSRLCYSNQNRAKLQQLEYDRSSAQAFYEFDMRSSTRYQEEYDRTGASVYLDAKNRSEQSAQNNLNKRNAAVAAMQEIEKQGW
jgi:hypothetical protein